MTDKYAIMNGDTSSIAIPSNASIDNLNVSDFTIEFYIRARSGETSYHSPALFTKDDGGWTDGWAIFLDQYSDSCNVWAFMGASGSHATTYEYTGFAADEWVHIALVWKASETMWHICINGEWIEEYPTPIDGVLGTDTGVDLRIGNDAFPNGLDNPAPFADFSWVRISSGARYTPTVAFTPPSSETPPAIDETTVELWKFQDWGELVKAEVSSANDGTATDVVWVGTEPPYYTYTAAIATAPGKPALRHFTSHR